jgi:hypothetical protein
MCSNNGLFPLLQQCIPTRALNWTINQKLKIILLNLNLNWTFRMKDVWTMNNNQQWSNNFLSTSSNWFTGALTCLIKHYKHKKQQISSQTSFSCKYLKAIIKHNLWYALCFWYLCTLSGRLLSETIYLLVGDVSVLSAKLSEALKWNSTMLARPDKE